MIYIYVYCDLLSDLFFLLYSRHLVLCSISLLSSSFLSSSVPSLVSPLPFSSLRFFSPTFLSSPSLQPSSLVSLLLYISSLIPACFARSCIRSSLFFPLLLRVSSHIMHLSFASFFVSTLYILLSL